MNRLENKYHKTMEIGMFTSTGVSSKVSPFSRPRQDPNPRRSKSGLPPLLKPRFCLLALLVAMTTVLLPRVAASVSPEEHYILTPTNLEQTTYPIYAIVTYINVRSKVWCAQLATYELFSGFRYSSSDRKCYLYEGVLASGTPNAQSDIYKKVRTCPTNLGFTIMRWTSSNYGFCKGHFTAETKNFDDALSSCKSMNGTLYSLNNKPDYDHLESDFSDPSETVDLYIGLYYDAADRILLRVQDGKVPAHRDIAWLDNEPNLENKCVAFHTIPLGYKTVSCDSLLGYTCQIFV